MAIFRLIIPGALFRLCGGRVENLGDLQPLAVKAGLNGVMMGNFLTTLGAEPEDDRAMFEELGLNVARQPDNGANPRPDNRSGWLDGETPATPMEELIDHQDEAPTSGTPRPSCGSIKKDEEAAAVPEPDAASLAPRGGDRRRAPRLEELRERGPLPAAATDRGAAGPAGDCSTGAPVLLLCSNDYLGLADHRAGARGGRRGGACAGAPAPAPRG